MKFLDRLFDILTLPEIVSDIRRRVEKLEAGPIQYQAREPKVFIVADEQEKIKTRS